MSYGVNAPVGFVPEKHLDGSTWNGQLNTFLIQNAYATSLFTGDPVTLASGYLVIGVNDSGLLGVFQGCNYVNATGTYVFSPYWPASTATQGSVGANGQVVVDPTVLYNVQLDASAATQASIGQNAQFVAHAGSTVTGNSGYALGAPATGNATYCFKVESLVPVPGNTFGLTYNNVFVLINNHLFKGGTGTAGV